jgi:hypothetical protein
MYKFSIFIILLLATKIVSAQYFNTGQDPASLRWRQINTKNFQLIYPEVFENQAQRMANILEKVYGYDTYSLDYNPKKISVVFHTQTLVSNGMLAWAPRRVEMYTTPTQSMYAQDWLEQLAIHEFRHVVQVGKISQNLPKIIPLLSGQQGTALVTGLYLPFWFIEGDAVATETALSQSGRGRFTPFLNEIKAQVVEKGKYSFEKAYLGSYKNFVPDHYRLGYYLVGGVRNLFGPEIWDKMVLNVGKKPFSITPVNSALKKQTGYNQRQLYSLVFDSLRTSWLNQGVNKDSIRLFSKKTNIYTSYIYNFFTKNGSILTYKTALNSLPQFVLIESDGKEKKLIIPGEIFDESVDATDDFLTWSELIPDPRWEHGGKSLIHVLDIVTKKEKLINPEFKGFSPSVSLDGKKIALIEVDYCNNYYLSVYEIATNKLLARYQTSDNNYLVTPRWVNDKELACIVLTTPGKSLALIDPIDEKIEFLANEVCGEIKSLIVNGSDIFFISSYSGQNDLYNFNLKSKKIFRVYASRFGVDYPAISPDGKTIVLSDYTADGFRLIEIQVKRDNWEPIGAVRKGEFELADKLTKQEKGIPDFTSNSDTLRYISEKYSKAEHLLYFHSWLPAYFDVDSYKLQSGVSFMSQNMLGTAETSVGYKWDASEKSGKFYGKFTYKGWYPVMSSEINYGKRSAGYYSITNYTNSQHELIKSDTVKKRFFWNESTFTIDAYIPFNFTKGKYYRLLQPEIKYELISRSATGTAPDQFVTGLINSATYRIYFHQILKESYQDLVPNFGYVVDLTYRNSPGGNLNLGNLTSFQFINYFPGILPNHGIVIYNGFQKRTFNEGYAYSDVIRYPRGWGSTLTNQIYSFSAEYRLPLIYPDLSLGKLLYLKRLKASLYADYANLEGNTYKQGKVAGKFNEKISSYGTEITGDMHFFRFYAPFNAGVRIGYLPEVKQFNYELLLSVNFTSF